MRKLFSFMVLMAMFLPWVVQAQTAPASLPYICGFEDATENGNWTIVNGNSTNKFFIGSAVNNGGTQSLYISNNATGSTYNYSNTAAGYVFAYREIQVATDGGYTFTFDWNANGESTYDYLRVFLIPANATDTIVPKSGTTNAHTGVTATAAPSTWITIDGGTKLNLISDWASFASDEISLTAGTYKLAFYWRNDGSGGSQSPAAIDNINVSPMLCSRPVGIALTSVDAYSATISWNATTANTFVYVNDTLGAPRQWNINATTLNTNSVTIEDLTPNTVYRFYLQSLCGNDTSIWLSFDYRTNCIAVSDDLLPYHESFESWSSGNFDPCYVATNNNATAVSQPAINTSNHSDSLKSLYMYSTAAYASWLAFPPFESDINSLQVSFDMYKTTATAVYPLLVGVMSNRDSISTFDTIAIAYCPVANKWQRFTFSLTEYNGDGQYLAFVSPNGIISGNYIDNIVVDYAAACSDASAIDITGLTETTATIEWQNVGSASYVIEYGNIGFTPGMEMGTTEFANGESFTITDLTGNTPYHLYMRSDCSGDTGNWFGPLTFRTSCPEAIDLSNGAYIEDFDSYTASTSQTSYAVTNELPGCWNFWTDGTNGSTGAYFPRIYKGTAVSPTNSNNNLQMAVMHYTGTTATTLGYVTQRGEIKIATLPVFNEPLSDLTISFEAKTTAPSSTNAYNDTIFVAVATTDSTYIPLTYVTSSDDLIVVEEELGQYASLIPTSGNARLALVFKAGSFSSSTVRYCGIDNVVVMRTPTCKRPYDGAITNVTATTATYVFTDSINSNNYEIIWNTIDDIELTLAEGANYSTATDTTGEITNLEPATTYYAWVRSVCTGEYSPWTELGRFITECYPLDTLPFYEDFDSYTTDVVTSSSAPAAYPNHSLPTCWKFINLSESSSTYPQAFVTSWATYNPNGGNSLFFKSSQTTLVYAVLPKIDANIEDLQLTFSYRNEGVSAYNGTLWVGVMTDPTNDSTFIALEAMPQTNVITRAEYTFFADTMTGTDYYIAFRYSGGTGQNYYMSIDSISVHTAPACRRSLDLTADNITTNSADLTWVNGSASSYIIAVSTTEGFNPDTCTNLLTSATESVTLTGLADYTTYYFAVKAVCGSDSGAWSQVARFKTTMECNGLDFVEPIIGNPNATTSNSTYPFYSTSTTYPRGITWQLYTQVELEEQHVYSGNSIKAIAYQYTGSTAMNAPRINVYMTEIDTNFIGVADTVALSQMTLVFSGSQTFSNSEEWSSIMLDTPFNYSGSRNLLVAVERDTTVNVAGSFKYTAGGSTDYRCVYSYTTTSGSKSAVRTVNRSNIRFSICTSTPACERPDSIVVSNVQPTQADVAWVGNGTTYDVAYGPRGFDIDSTNTYQVVTGITTNHTTLTNLTDGENYDVYVRGNCTQPVASSEWSYKAMFTTPCLPQSVPYIEDFDSYTTDVATAAAPTSSYPNHLRPDCWNLLNLSATSTTYPQAFMSSKSDYALSGNCLFFRSSSTAPVFAVLPKLNANINTLQILFSYRNEGTSASNHIITLGVMTDPSDTSTFIPVKSYPKITTVTTVEHLFGFDTLNGNNYYIAFRYTGGTGNNMWAAIDSIVVDYMPSCPKPINLAAGNLTETSAELSWSGNSSNYMIEYGPVGFEIGTGTIVTSNTNSITLNGLTHSTRYEYYVKAVCGANDSSEWSLESCIFRTECGIVSALPWYADLDGTWYYYPNNDNNARFPSCWSMSNGGAAAYNWRNTTTASNIRTGSYAIYYYGSYSSSVEHDDWLITPELQLTGNEQLVFWMKNASTSTSSSTYSYDARVAIYAYTVDANDSVVTPDDFILVNPYITLAPGQTQYQEQIVPLTGLTGNVRLAFVVDTTSYTFYIDDIVVEAMPSCPKPRLITADSVSQTTVELSWVSDATNFIVEYKRSVDTVWDALTGISTNTTVVTGLAPSTAYDFRIKAVCSATDSSVWSNIVSEATLCGAVSLPFFENFSSATFPSNCWERMSGDLTTGSGTTVSSGWVRMTNSYGLDDAHAKFNIYGLNRRYSLITPEIDLGSTPGAELTFDLALTDYNNGDTIETDKDTYDDKFMVIISNDGGATWSQANATIWSDDTTISANYSFRGISASGEHVTIDLSQYYGDTIKIAFYGESTVSDGDNDLHIDNILVQSACPAPVITDVTPDATTATIAWSASATDFQVAYKEATASEWSAEENVTNATTYTFSGLLPETSYQFRVRAMCNEGEYSAWTTGTFTTLVLPCIAPTNITATEITNNSAVIGWEAQDNQISWEVRYATQGQDTTVVATTNPITISNLYYGQTYQVWVRAFCGADTYSDWSEPISFSTLSCSPISNLTVTTVGTDNATLTWTAEAGQTEWEISYGPEGFSEGNGTVVNVSNTPTYQITGLESGIKYDAYVRAKCSEGFYSAWSPKVTFTTTVGINTAEGNSLNANLFPNPATKEATIAVEGVNGKVEIIVSDLNGRTLIQEETTCNGQFVKSINVEQWAKGTYFVRIINNDAVAIQKLIVR